MQGRSNVPLNKVFSDESLPPLPAWVVLGHHATQKFMQVGTFAFITASPFYWMYQTKLRAQPQPFHAGAFLRKYYPRTLGVSTGVGAAVALYYVFLHLDEEAVTERAYRLAHNHANNRVEQRGLMAAAAGSVLYPVLFDKGVPVVTRALRGASFGYAAGIVVALVLEGFFKKK